MAACLLTDAPLVLTNVPKLAMCSFMADILRQLGVAVDWTLGNRLGGAGAIVSPRPPLGTTADYDIVRKMRASFLILDR